MSNSFDNQKYGKVMFIPSVNHHSEKKLPYFPQPDLLSGKSSDVFASREVLLPIVGKYARGSLLRREKIFTGDKLAKYTEQNEAAADLKKENIIAAILLKKENISLFLSADSLYVNSRRFPFDCLRVTPGGVYFKKSCYIGAETVFSADMTKYRDTYELLSEIFLMFRRRSGGQLHPLVRLSAQDKLKYIRFICRAVSMLEINGRSLKYIADLCDIGGVDKFIITKAVSSAPDGDIETELKYLKLEIEPRLFTALLFDCIFAMSFPIHGKKAVGRRKTALSVTAKVLGFDTTELFINECESLAERLYMMSDMRSGYFACGDIQGETGWDTAFCTALKSLLSETEGEFNYER